MTAEDGARRVIEGGVTLLLLVIPWHELVVHLWRPLGGWDDAVVVCLVAALAVRGPARLDRRLLWPLLAMALAGAASCASSGQPLWALRDTLEYMVVALAAAQVERDRIAPLLRRVVLVGGLAAAFGIVSFVTFRLVGGGLHMRPPVPPGTLQILTWPYYCGVYPRGEHLVGPFLNDLYFGVWLVAVLSMSWAVWRPGDRWLQASSVLVALAAAWTLERTALVCLLASAAFIALHTSWRLLLVPLAAMLAALPVLRSYDRLRFSDLVEGNEGRLAMLSRAADTLRAGPFLGNGPRAVTLSDCQYAKWVHATGWPGLLALGWLLAAVVAPAMRRHAPRLTVGLGATVVALALGGLTSELWEVPQTAYTLWIAAGLLQASTAAVAQAPHGQDSDMRD